MDILTIIASIAIGILIGMSFEAVYNAETRRFNHEQIRKLNAENIMLKHQIRDINQKRVNAAVEIIDLPQPDRTYHEPW